MFGRQKFKFERELDKFVHTAHYKELTEAENRA